MRSLIVLAVLAISGVAAADVPVCDGNDAATAAEGLKRGKELYAAGVDPKRSAEERRAKLAEALAEVDKACRSGEIGGLRRRAQILATMGDWVGAAVSVDAYLVAAGDHRLEADEQQKFDQVRTLIDNHVASIRVLAPPDAHIELDGAAAIPVKDLLRTSPGSHTVLVRTSEGEPVVRRVDLKAGAIVEVAATTASSPQQHVADPPPSNPRPDSPVPKQSSSYTPWIIAGSTATGVFLGVGIAATIYAEDRATTFNKFMCGGANPQAGCGSVKSESDAGRAMEATMFIAAGAAAITTGVFVFFQLRRPEPTKPNGWACGPTGAGLVCAGAF